MKAALKTLFISLLFGFMLLNTQQVKAQCAACAAAVATNQKSGDHTTRGLNNGILFLLAAPYLAAAAVGFVWYKKYRRKNVNLLLKDERLHLN